MAKVDREAHGGGESKPSLTPELLGGVDFLVLTVAEARVNIRVGGRLSSLLEFEEYPDHSFWLNKTGVDAMCDRLGEESDEWAGQRIPLVKVRTQNPQTGRYVEKYWVDGDDWDETIAEFDKRTRKRGPKKGVKAPAKRGKKKTAKK